MEVSASVAPISRADGTSIARVRAITPVVMDTDATTALPTARMDSIAAAAVARVQDHAQAARTSQTTHSTQVRDPSVQTIVHGNATRDTIKAAVSVTAARISRAVPTSIARVHVTILVAMDTSATAAQPIARRVSIVVAAVAPARAHA